MHAWNTLRSRGFFLVIFLFTMRPTSAATFSVCDEASLRAAITEGGTVMFACDGVIYLTNTLSIAADVAIDGSGRTVTISGSNAARLFFIQPTAALTLRNLTLADGLVRGADGPTPFLGGPVPSGSPGEGAGVYNSGGILRAFDCAFLGNKTIGGNGRSGFYVRPGVFTPSGPGGSGSGAAICNSNGLVVASNCVFSGNSARGGIGGSTQQGGSGEGAAIYSTNGTVELMECVFVLNEARGGTGGTAPEPPPGGSGIGGQGQGGAVQSVNGTVAATNCTFVANRSIGGDGGTNSSLSAASAGGNAIGGAIHGIGGVVYLWNSVISSNRVVSGLGRRFNCLGCGGSGFAHGGAIYTESTEFALVGGTVSGNSCFVAWNPSARGGAAYQSGGRLNISDCLIASNRVNTGVEGYAYGGAIYVQSGDFLMSNSTLANNLAQGGTPNSAERVAGSALGGGMFNNGNAGILNCTIVNNTALGGIASLASAGNGLGGGIYNDNGSMDLKHVTLVNNTARLGTGGLSINPVSRGGCIFSTNGTVTLHNSILSRSPSGSNCFGIITDGGHNISSDASCNFTAPGSLNNTDPVLGPLADYGGPTPTMALLAGSPAIDAADTSSCPATDQRGITRPFGAGCDIGAFESSPPYTILGQVTGYITSPDGIQLAAGSSSNWIDGSGSFALHALSTGSYLVTPSSPDAVFVLSNRLVNLGPDAVGISFHSYRSNALSIEQIAVGAVRAVFASEAGQTFRVDVSQDGSAWSPYSTNTTETSGLFEFWDTNSAVAQPRLFRTLKP